MGSSSSALKPQELAEFRKLNPSQTLPQLEIPELQENRTATDRNWLIVFIVFVILLMPFLIYTLVYSDIRRLFVSYDTCGQFCGDNNPKVDGIDCSGKNYVDLPYLKYERTELEQITYEKLLREPRHCVSDCGSDYVDVAGICIYAPNKQSDNDVDGMETQDISQFLQEVSEDLKILSWRIILAGLISLGLGLGMLFLFRYAVAMVVWSIVIGSVLALGALAGFLWFCYVKADDFNNVSSSEKKTANDKQVFLFLAGIVSLVFLILVCVTVFMVKKIKLVIMLLKETTKAVFAIPSIILIPIITFLLEMIILTIVIYTTLLISTSGVLKHLELDLYTYKANIVMTFTLFFNWVIAFWATQFIIGIQYMVIAGAISKWFFAKNKNYLDSPISSSAGIVFKFHLGTVALGSLIITLVAIIREVIKGLINNKTTRIIVECCIANIEEFIKFMSKQAYIQTAMHGQSFFRSGKRAAKLIVQNAVNIVAVNSVGDFVLGMAQLLVILASLLFGVLIMQGADVKNIWAAYVIIFVIALALALCLFSVFETAIDTIFICFCEDSLMNDGLSRPYAMSTGLMEFIEESKKVLGEKKR